MKCYNENKHDHKPIMIVGELENQHLKWQTLKSEIVKYCQKVLPAFKEYEPLILYLESAMMDPNVKIQKPVKWLSSDIGII